MSGHKSEKKGSNIICRVSNITPEMVCRYVSRLPKQVMKESMFRNYMGKSWFQNEHQAPEQWGLYYIDGLNYYPRFNREISLEEADAYIYHWMRNLIVINPYTRFKTTNDNNLVESIVHQLEKNPNEHDLKTVFRNIIGTEEPFIVNEIIANALNKYSEVLSIDFIDKENEKYNVSLLPNYEKTLKTYKKMTKKEYFDLFNDIAISSHQNDPRQLIFYGAPGTGKSHEIKELTQGETVLRTTFHPDSDYSTFVGCYKPTMDSGRVYGAQGPLTDNGKPIEEPRITYKFILQAFLKAYLGAWKKYTDRDNDSVRPQFLIIEEINRGNCAQIFGDLFQLLDRGDNGFSEYPIEADTDLQKEIKRAFIEHESYKLVNKIDVEGVIDDYTSNYGATLSEDIQEGRVLLLPKNLFIWATMNTSDQSLFPIDSAFKRRWEWKYIPINNHEEKGYKIKVGAIEYSWWGFLVRINQVIGTVTSSEDKKLGYFFTKAENKEIKAEQFVGKVLFYLWNDVFKNYGFDNPIFHKKEDKNSKYEYSDFFFPDGKPNIKNVNEFMKNLDEKIKVNEIMILTKEEMKESDSTKAEE